MDGSEATLEDLRREIDAIDAEMHALIRRRAALVERVRAVKARDGTVTVKPGREAEILRALAARHDGEFPFAAVARIWREIIAGITRMEMAEYSIAVYMPGDDHACWDFARNQFGSATPMTGFASTREVLREIDAGNATLGVLPMPHEGGPDLWWTGLATPDGLRVSYRLPFAPGDGTAPSGAKMGAFAVGKVPPDASSRDRSLIVVETAETVSRTGLSGLLEKAGLRGTVLASAQQGAWFHLLDVEGFATQEDEAVTELSRLSGVDRVTVIGAYADPMGAAT
jgi:chorismate mutase